MSIDIHKNTDGVAVVTLNRPQSLNALDVPAKKLLGMIWRDLADDNSVRAVVLTGSGTRAFCAGSDIKEMARTGQMADTETLLNAMPNAGHVINKPIIAAVFGVTFGFGLNLAIHCDLRIAQENSRLSFPEVPHGMITGASVRLPQIIPQAKAFEYLLLGEEIPLKDALAFGLLNQVVPDALETALSCARKLAAMPNAAVSATKSLIRLSSHLSEDQRREIAHQRALVEAQRDFMNNASDFDKRNR